MEVECNRHPGASTNDRQLLDETDFLIFFPVSHGWQILATQPWVPMQVRRRASIKLIWYTVETKEGWVGGTTQKLCSNAEQPYNKHEESMHMWQENTADCTSFPILQYLLYLKACTGVQEHTEKNTWERRPLKMHWCKCLTKHHWTQRNVDIGKWITMIADPRGKTNTRCC